MRGTAGAFLYVGLAVAGLAAVPLLVSLVGASASPFYFNAAWRVGLAFGGFLVLAVAFGGLLFNLAVWRVAGRQLVCWAMFFLLLDSLDYGVFVWSTVYLDVAVAGVIVGLWPIVYFLVVSWGLRAGPGLGRGAYSRNVRSVLPFLLLAAAGLALVVLGQAGGALELEWGDGRLWVGLAIALLAAGLASCGSFSFLWGRDLAAALASALPGLAVPEGSARLLFFTFFLGLLLATLVGIGLNAGLGLARGEPLLPAVLLWAVFGGCTLQAVSSVLLRVANLVTHNLGVNALFYAAPALTLGYLWAFGPAIAARGDFLLAGAAGIIVANLAIGVFDGRGLLGARSAFLVLWAAGAWGCFAGW